MKVLGASTEDTTVARCLLDPGFLDMLASQEPVGPLPRSGDSEGVSRPLDLAQLRLFAGFISKVQHNDLWDDFPYTRALLKLTGRELETFAAYRDTHLRLLRVGRPSRELKTTTFLDFLQGLLSRSAEPQDGALLDVLIHERALWQTRLALEGIGLPTDCGSLAPPLKHTHVAPHDVLTVATVERDPTHVIEALREGGQGWTQLPVDKLFLCYWGRADKGQVKVLAVDSLTASILAAVCKGTAVAEIVKQASHLNANIDVDTVVEVLHQLAEVGLVLWVDPDDLGKVRPCV